MCDICNNEVWKKVVLTAERNLILNRPNDYKKEIEKAANKLAVILEGNEVDMLAYFLASGKTIHIYEKV